MGLEVFGVIGAIISQAAGVPQLLRLFKTRKARDVSLLTFVMLCVGNLIMLFYFSINLDIVGLTFSSFGTVMCLILIVVTILFRRNVNHEEGGGRRELIGEKELPKGD